MFVPPSPSQPEDTPGSIRRPTSLPGKGKVPGDATEESGAENGCAGRMVDKRRRVETAGTAADNEGGGSSSSGSGSSGGRLPAAVVADQEKPTPISLSEAKQALDGDGDDWRPKVAALRQLQDQLAAADGPLAAEDARDVVSFMESLAAACRALKNTKPEVAGAPRVTQLVCAVISGLAKAVGTGFCAPAAAIIPDLLPFLSTPREAVQEAVATSVEEMLAECPSPSVLRAATVSLVSSKKAYLRRKGSGFLCVAIQRWPRDALRTTLPPIMGQMRKALFDADATVRREGRHTFGVFIRLWPAEGGGMYHALDRANQRAVLQEQPHVSNFIGGKTLKDGAGSGGSGNATTAAAGSAAAPSTAAAASKLASSVSETSPPTSAVLVADKSTAAIAAAAAASAATRFAMATGGGGGGGQRPAGVTQAQHRSLVALKVERDRRLRDQQRLAAAGVTKGLSSTSSTGGRVAGGGGNRPTSKPAEITVEGNGGGGGCNDGGISLSSIPAVLSAPSSPTTAGAAGVSAFGFRSPTAGGASRLPAAPSSSCSDGLRRAARLALRKNDLMSPTLKRLLQDPAQLRTAGSAAGRFGREEEVVSGEAGAGRVSSPGSEESGLGTEGDGTGGVGVRMTPSELRGSTSGASPIGGGGSSVGNDSYLSSCSSGSGGEVEYSDSDGEFNVEGGGSTKRGRNHLPTRVLFGLEQDGGNGDNGEDSVEPPPPPQSPKQQRTSAIARAAASASAARYAALEMKPPPPRPPAPAPISTLPEAADTTSTAEHPKLAGLGCPSPRGSVSCTPTKGILAGRSGKKAPAAASSTVKRRVRFEMEERARAAASLNSPCRSSSSLAPGWWSRASAAGSEEEEARRGERGWRSVRHRVPVVLSALTVAVSVGVVAFLGGGEGVGVGAGHRGIARWSAGCYSSPSSSSSWSPVCLPWAVKPEPEVCPSVTCSDGPARIVVAEQGNGLEDASAAEQAAGVSAEKENVAEEAPLSVVDDVVVEHAAAGAVPDEGEGEGVANHSQGAPAGATASADLDREHQQPPAEHHHYHHHIHHYEAETGSSTGDTGEGASASAAASHPTEPSPSAPSAAASDSVWGWFEVGAATLSAAILLATVVWRSRGAVDGGDGWGGGDGPSTPLAGGGDRGEGQELGRYQTVEMIKKGDTPATIRSVKRSRRFGSAQKPAPPGMMVVDLGAAALDMSNMNMG